MRYYNTVDKFTLDKNDTFYKTETFWEDEENGKITDFVSHLFAFKFCPNCG